MGAGGARRPQWTAAADGGGGSSDGELGCMGEDDRVELSRSGKKETGGRLRRREMKSGGGGREGKAVGTRFEQQDKVLKLLCV